MSQSFLYSSAVHAAYIASLESQISSLRDEMAAVYKTQGQNAQRLLSMNETLREKEELARVDADNLRQARDELAVLRRKVEQHDELMAEKDRGIQVSLEHHSTRWYGEQALILIFLITNSCYTTKSTHSTWNSIKSQHGMITSKLIMPHFYNVG